MADVSLAGALLAGLISFLSPCVLPLVPGYISMLSGIGMEELREGDVSKGGLLLSAFSFVLGFSVVFISFGASASAVGSFLRQNRNILAPLAGGFGYIVGVPVAAYLTWQGRLIEGKGVSPSFNVEMRPEQLLAGEDPQMQRALEVVRGM